LNFVSGEEILKLSNILNMDLSEAEANTQYNVDANLKFVQALMSDEDRFIRIVQQLGY
jgi:hypothetical protein